MNKCPECGEYWTPQCPNCFAKARASSSRPAQCSADAPEYLKTPRTDAFVSGMTVLADDQPLFQKLVNFCRELEQEWNQRNQACDDYAVTIYRQSAEIKQLKASAAQPNDSKLSHADRQPASD